MLDQTTFEIEHRAICARIIECLTNSPLKKKEKVTFGRAAKLLAVYLKSVVVLGERSKCALSNIAHPPIDSILLSKLAEETTSEHKKEWAKIKWTTLGDADYYKLIAQLRAILPPGAPFWMLERHWTVTSKDED